MAQRPKKQAAIEAEIDCIQSLGLDLLRERWRLAFGAAPPPGLTKHLLARMIAHRLQEKAFGGLDRESVKLLDRVARGQKPDVLHRRLKLGTVLVREYLGERHTVTIAANGFVWQGQSYPNLSTIAREITGTNWSGPRFFGLRERPKRGPRADEPSPLRLPSGSRRQRPFAGRKEAR